MVSYRKIWRHTKGNQRLLEDYLFVRYQSDVAALIYSRSEMAAIVAEFEADWVRRGHDLEQLPVPSVALVGGVRPSEVSEFSSMVEASGFSEVSEVFEVSEVVESSGFSEVYEDSEIVDVPPVTLPDWWVQTTDYLPTAEQIQAVKLALKNDDLIIQAFAGAGKTSTLMMIAAHKEGRGQYLAFNRQIVNDVEGHKRKVEAASGIDLNLKANTSHSLALRYLRSRKEYKNLKIGGNLKPDQIANWCGLDPQADRRIAVWCLDVLRRYCQSSDAHIAGRHVNTAIVREKLAVIYDDEKELEKAVNEAVKRLIPAAKRVWEYVWKHVEDGIDVPHDFYLKQWALHGPQIHADYLLVDEAQDTNPVVLGVLAQQNCPVIYVGDTYQQIYAWRGAINAMESVDAKHQCRLTQSFRFGPEIARLAQRVLATVYRDVGPIRGTVQKSTAESDQLTVICRTNIAVVHTCMGLLARYAKRGQPAPKIANLSFSQRDFGLIRGIDRMSKGKPPRNAELDDFRDYTHFVEYCQTESGAEYNRYLSLVKDHDVDRLIAALEGCQASEKDADYVVLTAHKSKGREWDCVQLSDDYPALSEFKGSTQELVNLVYVALTRAKYSLSYSDCDTIMSILNAP